MGCGHFPSGRYIQVQRSVSSKELGKVLNIPSWQIEKSNKKNEFKEGDWVYLPHSSGILGQAAKSLSIDEVLSNRSFLWPVPSSTKITSRFGKRWGKKHEGIDIAGRSGSHIVSTMDGVVVYSGNKMGGYGNITIISHAGGYFSIYAHAKKNFTRRGERVVRGQVIAQVGSTGRSTGPHLHFEIRRNSRPINPKKLLSLK